MDLLQEKLLASTDFSSWEKHVVYFCVLAMRDAHKDEVEKAVGTLGLETIKKFFEQVYSSFLVVFEEFQVEYT